MKQTFTSLIFFLFSTAILSAQATLVKDINPGTGHADQTFYNAMPIHIWQGKAYFAATDGSNGIELWVSDGTEAGTKLLKDINPGAGASQPDYFTIYQGKLYFAATGPAGRELWVSDGSPEGTVQFKDIYPGTTGSGPTDLCVAGTTLFFSAAGTAGRELWKSNGTAAGTVLVVDLLSSSSGSKPKYLTALGAKVCFSVDDLNAGEELYISDGTEAGTKLVKDINPGFFGSFPKVLRVVNGKLYFGASPETGSSKEDIWVSDGTPEGTKILIPGGYLLDVVELNGKAIIAAGSDLYVSDGTVQNTIKLVSLSSMFTRNINHTRLMGVAGGLAFFSGEKTQFSTGQEMWVTDGTAAGTKLLTDLYKGFISSSPTWLTPVGAKIYYAGDYKQDVSTGIELLETDGTAGGTKVAADITTGTSGSNPGPIVQLNETTLLFMAQNQANGRELWKYTLKTSTPTLELRAAKDLLSFSPNPAQDQLQVRSLRADAGDGVLSIHNLLGQVVYQQTLRAQESKSIPLTGLSKGVYTLSLQQGEWVQVEKLMIH